MHSISAIVATTAALFSLLFVPTRQDNSSVGTTAFDGAKDVTFYLFTQDNPSEAQFIKLDNDSTSPNFNPDNPTRMVVHGWEASVNKLLGIKNAFIATGIDYNIILVDWNALSNQTLAKSAKSAVYVGKYMGQMLNHLIASRGLDPDALTVIGHSMGCHIAGIASRGVGRRVVSEVIALDPGKGIVENNPVEDQLNISDAKFVQVIHTNINGSAVLGNYGDVEFFPDGGYRQDMCSDSDEDTYGCSHNIVVDYFIESIISQGFIGTQCTNYSDYLEGKCRDNDEAVMGEWTSHTKRGSYYLTTNTQYPYAQGETGL